MGITPRRAPLLGGLSLLALAALAPLGAAPAEAVYTEGESMVRYRSGSRGEASIGDRLDTGDTLTTGVDGFVEMDRSGVSIKVQPKTVFTPMEREEAGRKAGVLAVALGPVRYRYGRLTGREPRVQTNSCVLGARGTEFTVFAGADGSSLIVVESGQVAVESAGAQVELHAEEGVEVQPGRAPGEKFRVLIGKVDYSKWNEEKLQAMLADPLQAMAGVNRRMNDYVREVAALLPVYLARRDLLSLEMIRSCPSWRRLTFKSQEFREGEINYSLFKWPKTARTGRYNVRWIDEANAEMLVQGRKLG